MQGLTREHFAGVANIPEPMSTNWRSQLSRTAYEMGRVGEAGSFEDFLRALGSSITRPAQKPRGCR
jgi:hypothetical protein